MGRIRIWASSNNFTSCILDWCIRRIYPITGFANPIQSDCKRQRCYVAGGAFGFTVAYAAGRLFSCKFDFRADIERLNSSCWAITGFLVGLALLPICAAGSTSYCSAAAVGNGSANLSGITGCFWRTSWGLDEKIYFISTGKDGIVCNRVSKRSSGNNVVAGNIG